jgi:hypothetical protein
VAAPLVALEARVTQSSKRPGAKDISELKARLGLKKSGPAAARGGMAAPPGARAAGVIPAPPGAQPPRPHIPDAKEDPFGAMNALAAHGAQVQQPQFVVVNEGPPAEEVQKRARARLLMIGGLMVLPLVFGIAVGKISSGAKLYNRTIEDAAVIRDEVKKTRDGLIGVQQVLASAKLRAKGNFAPGDAKLTAELEALPPLRPNIEQVFNSFMYELPPELVGATLSFYTETIQLNDLIKKHVQMAKDAERIFKEGHTKVQGFNPFGYAALLEVPSADQQAAGSLIALKMVQLGSPVCEGQNTPSESGCPGRVSGFRYRVDELGNWGVKKVATADGGNVASDGIVVLDTSSKVLQQVVKGGEVTVAEAGFLERINRIDELVNDLIERQKAIESRLNSKAIESKKFTFFM